MRRDPNYWECSSGLKDKVHEREPRSMRESKLLGTHGSQLSDRKILNTCTVPYGSHQSQVAVEELLSKKLVRLKDRGLTFI